MHLKKTTLFTEAPVFTIDEFARLLVLLSTHDSLRELLISSARELTREELEQEISSNESGLQKLNLFSTTAA